MRKRLVACCLVLGIVALCSLAQDAAAQRSRERTFTSIARSGSDEAKQTAIKRVLTRAIDLVLREQGALGKLDDAARAKLITACRPLLRSVRWTPRRGGAQFRLRPMPLN